MYHYRLIRDMGVKKVSKLLKAEISAEKEQKQVGVCRGDVGM